MNKIFSLNYKNFVFKYCRLSISNLQIFELMLLNHYLELPWDEPTKTNKEYLDWLNNKVNRTPWIKMDSHSLGMHGCVVFLPRKYVNMILVKHCRYAVGAQGTRLFLSTIYMH